MHRAWSLNKNYGRFLNVSNSQDLKTENDNNHSKYFPPINNSENLEIKNDDEVKNYELNHEIKDNECNNSVSSPSTQEERVFNILQRNPDEAWKYIHNRTSTFKNDKLLKTLYYYLTPKAIQRLNMRIHKLCTKNDHAQHHHERRRTNVSSLRPDNMKIINEYNDLKGMKQKAFKRDVLKVTTTALTICGEDWQIAQTLLNNLQTRAKPPIIPDTIICNAALKVSARSGNVDEMLRLRQEMKDKGILPDTTTYATMISAYKTTGNVDEALRLLQEMKDKGIYINETTYNTAISVCIINGNSEIALNLLQEMKDNAILKPDKFTYSAALATCATGQQWQTVVNLFQEMVDNRIPQDDIARSTAINACAKVGQLQKALDLLHTGGKNNTWSS